MNGRGSDDVVGPVMAVEPIDAPESQVLLRALWDDLAARYVGMAPPDDADIDLARDSYLADVRPDQVRAPSGVFVVVRMSGTPVACGALRPTDLPGVAEIKRMYVAPEARRLGLSRAVLERLEAEAAALGYARIRLETGIGQPEAMALYESAGWTAIDAYPPWDRVEWSRCYAKEVGGARP